MMRHFAVCTRRAQQRAFSQGVLCRLEGWQTTESVREGASQFGAVRSVKVEPSMFTAHFTNVEDARRVESELTHFGRNPLKVFAERDDESALRVMWSGSRTARRPSKEEWTDMVYPGTIEPATYSAFVIFEQEDDAKRAAARGMVVDGEHRACKLSERLPERCVYIDVPDPSHIRSIYDEIYSRGFNVKLRKLDHKDEVLLFATPSCAEAARLKKQLSQSDFPYRVFNHTDKRVDSMVKSVMMLNTREVPEWDFIARLKAAGVSASHVRVRSNRARVWFDSVASVDELMHRVETDADFMGLLQRSLADSECGEAFEVRRKRFIVPREQRKRRAQFGR